MPNIQFPDVPDLPGVPQLIRPVESAIASSPVLAVSLGSLSDLLAQSNQQPSRWGIFDQNGNQIGIPAGSQSFADTIQAQLTGATLPESTTTAFDFRADTRVSDFPIEGGSFASYNKVQLPINPVVTLTLKGSELDRAYFLGVLEAARISTDLFNVVTPEVTFTNYTIESYTYRRTARSGATLLIVEVYLKEIREVSSLLTQSIVNIPQDATATTQQDNGKVQSQAPDQSTLKALANKFSGLMNSITGGSQ